MTCQQECLELIAELCLQRRCQLLAGLLLSNKDEVEKIPELLFPVQGVRSGWRGHSGPAQSQQHK
jgi:hypothetical protein